MSGTLWLIGAATVLFAGVVAYAMTRRYGWGIAVMLPVLALIVMIAMRWQNEEMTLQEGLGELLPTLVFAAPVLLGSLVGVAIARIRRA